MVEKEKEKPIDLWLALGAIAVGIIYYWLEKTRGTLIISLIAIFFLLLHPLWNFWWIEKTRGRRICTLIAFIFLLSTFGYFHWPSPIVAQSGEKTATLSEEHKLLTAEDLPDFSQPVFPPAEKSTKNRSTTSKVEPAQPKQQESSSKQQPDISARLVSKKNFGIVLENISESEMMVVREPSLTVFIWDLDLTDRSDPLTKFTHIFKDDYIRKEAIFMAVSEIDKLPDVAPLIKLGHRLVGWITVMCPDCIRVRTYWIYAIHGEGGWFSELPKGRNPLLNTFVAVLPDIRKNPELFFRDIPESSRHSIEDLP